MNTPRAIDGLRTSFTNNLVSVKEVVSYYLDRIGRLDSRLHAFISVNGESAEKAAQVSDDRYHKKTARPLEGIPIAIKDNIAIKGMRTTAGSEILSPYSAAYTATAVKRLTDAGAIVLGKTNLDEFAMGASTEHSAFFPTANPHDHARVPGGSSGGSSAAVAADLCIAALGSDTGGSVRQPASFCGTVGFKPTYGRVSRFGLIAMSSSLDQIGPITHSVADAETLYATMAGVDSYDATTFADEPYRRMDVPLQGVKIGVPESLFTLGVDEEVLLAFRERLDDLKQQGAVLVPVDFKLLSYSLPVYYLLVTSEVSSNLARYDGIRYGTAASGETLEEAYVTSRTQGFGEEAKRRVLLGTFTLSTGYRDAYYLNALRVKRLIEQECENVFKTIDAMVCPTSPTVAFAIGEKLQDPLTMYMSDLFTVPANIANLPAISLPAGTVKKLPFGFQVMARHKADSYLLALARQIESVFGNAAPSPLA